MSEWDGGWSDVFDWDTQTPLDVLEAEDHAREAHVDRLRRDWPARTLTELDQAQQDTGRHSGRDRSRLGSAHEGTSAEPTRCVPRVPADPAAPSSVSVQGKAAA